MNPEEIKTLIRKLEAAGYEKVKENLRHNRYSSRKLTYINEWLEKQEGQTWLYHEFNEPKGKIFPKRQWGRTKSTHRYSWKLTSKIAIFWCYGSIFEAEIGSIGSFRFAK